MKKLLDKRMDYTLYREEDKLIFSVVCGTVAIYEITIYLTEKERVTYQQEGMSYIEKLARKVRNAPDAYQERAIQYSEEK